MKHIVGRVLAGAVAYSSAHAAAADKAADFHQSVEPVLIEYCFDCHGDGASKGDMAFDKFENLGDHLRDDEFWIKVWENLRSGLMPPADKKQPPDSERRRVSDFIQTRVLGIDPENPDPGRVTIRRLNRQEYRNTIRDLFSVDFKVDDEFPPDDTGYGFDNIGDVLSISPLLTEKYFDAAEKIVSEVVHTGGPLTPSVAMSGGDFKNDRGHRGDRMEFMEPAIVSRVITVNHPGKYRFTIELNVQGSSEFSYNTADLVVGVDGKEIKRRRLGWDNSDAITVSVVRQFEAGPRTLTLEMEPKDPPGEDERALTANINKIRFEGPLDGSYREYPKDYTRIFWDGPPSEDAGARTEYARKLLRHYASRAYRRPVDDETLDRLVALAETVASQPGRRFENGVADALTAILSSPQFLLRAEFQPDPNEARKVVPLDEFALASRLSYFLWSSLPDQELFDLAGKGQLRANLRPQVERMLEDWKANALVENFAGQWLQTRDVEAISVNPSRILGIRDRREAERVFSRRVREAMRKETEMLFAHIMKEDRSVIELIDPGYTFLNEPLARFYGIDSKGLDREKLSKVDLPGNSNRGGVLTHGSFLLVTSNPTRTSPVKRGLFVLENILGTPPPPPPEEVPALEEVARSQSDATTMRELLEIHREKPLCASCHARMDPIGLALENYNALGMWRDDERGRKIDPRGELVTGEKIADAAELRRVLATDRRLDFYRCLTEKLLTYALGRGAEVYDIGTIDRIADQLMKDEGKFSTLLFGVIESVPFQKRRGDG